MTINATNVRSLQIRQPTNEIDMSSLLLDETTIKKVDFETDNTRMLAEIMRNKWLS